MSARARGVQRGFHRLGLLLAVPVMLLAAALATQQLFEPSGSLKPTMPTGTLGARIDHPDATDYEIFAEQREHDVASPGNYVVLGIEITAPENRFHQFIDEGVETPEYTLFQLRDGREIVLGTTDQSKITNAVYSILRHEAWSGEPFPFDGPELAGEVPVRISANHSEPISPWPMASTQRKPDFTFVGVLSVIAALLYGLLAGLGWVIRGFFPEPG